jgi:hypothetical protein
MRLAYLVSACLLVSSLTLVVQPPAAAHVCFAGDPNECNASNCPDDGDDHAHVFSNGIVPCVALKDITKLPYLP